MLIPTALPIATTGLLALQQAAPSPYASQDSVRSSRGTHSPLASRSGCVYPDKPEIMSIFHNLETANATAFFINVAPNVTWTVEGTDPLAGTYHSRDSFYQNTILRLLSLESGQDPLQTHIVNIIGGCTDAWAAVELAVVGTMKNGLAFNNRYSWNCRFDTQGIIAQVRAYLDSELVARAVVSNEVPFYTFNDTRS